ncbi:MAG: nucleoside transporter C-terminal domain-containing protein [Planctomycetaceae bacterium]
MTEIARFQGVIGVLVLIGLAVLLSNNRRKIDWKLVSWGLGIQLLLALAILRTSAGHRSFDWANDVVQQLLGFSKKGADFLFATFGASSLSETPLNNFAFGVLPTVIFFSALLSVLYHLGVMQFVVKIIAWTMQKTMGTSGAETLSVAGNIFVGQTEAPLLVRPFLNKMTRSELMTVMVGGFATIAGGVLAIYVGYLREVPGIAGHLIAASLMSAPAGLLMSKILYPETEVSATAGSLHLHTDQRASNLLEAFGDGAIDGLKLALNIAAMLIAFIAATAMLNHLLGLFPSVSGEPLSLQRLLGWVFRPLAWTLGASWDESATLGSLLGQKIVLTELIAYQELGRLIPQQTLSPRTTIIASYALCGFANFASIGIQLGGIGAVAPDRKRDLASIALKAMIGGALASWMTASIAGILIDDLPIPTNPVPTTIDTPADNS